MSASPDQQRWKTLIKEKDQSLREITPDSCFRTKNSEGLQAYFSIVALNLGLSDASDAVDRFIASLEPLNSFTTAASAASQDEEGLQIIWAALHALIEGASHSTEISKVILEQVAELNQTLSPLESSFDHIPNRPRLQFILRELFDDYLGFCIRRLYQLRTQRRHKKLAVIITVFVGVLLLLAVLVLREPGIWSYPLMPIALSSCFLISGGIYFCFAFGDTRMYKRSSIADDLICTRATIKGYHRLLEKQIPGLGREPDRHDRTAPTKKLSYPLTDSPKFDPAYERSSGSRSLRILSGRPVQNFSFVGRESQLALLHNTLQSHVEPPRREPACCIIHGIGGIGKTQMALQYTYQYEQHYQAVFWLKAQTNIELAKSYAAIADHVGTAESTRGLSQDRDPGKGIDAAREWLQTTDLRWLLVFDNVDDLKNLTESEYIPRNPVSQGCMIITTQIQYFKQFTNVFLDLPLESLDTRAGFDLLFKTMGKDRGSMSEKEEDTVYEILNIVGGLPLAITTIGGHVHQTDLTLSEFLRELKQSNNIWSTSGKFFVENYEKTLRTVFDIVLKELEPEPRSLLQILAFLNPDCIPEEMFLSYKGKDTFLQLLNKKDTLTIMTKALKLCHLIDRGEDSDGHFLSLHRSLQLCILDGLSGDKATRNIVFDRAFELIRPQLPPASKIEISEPGVFHKYAKYVPQVISLRMHSLWPQPPLKLSLEFARVLANIGIYMWNVGLLKDGMAALETAEDVLKDLGHDKDDLMSEIDIPLGIILDFVGVSQRKKALFRRERALGIRTRTFDTIPKNDRTITDKIRLFNVEADTGCALLQQERFGEAMKKFESCLLQYKSWEPIPEKLPFEYSKYYNHSAFVLTSQGRYDEAIASSSRACELLELHSGPTSPLVLLYRFVLGNHLFHASDLFKSLKLNEEVLQRRRDICGETNSYTQESYSFTGMLLGLCKQHKKARKYLQTSLEANHRIHWSEEGVAYAHFRLAKILQEMGEHDEAVTHKAHAEVIRDRMLKAHPEYLKEYPDNEVAIYDQMIPIWSGRCTYRTKEGTTVTAVESKQETLELADRMSNVVEEV